MNGSDQMERPKDLISPPRVRLGHISKDCGPSASWKGVREAEELSNIGLVSSGERGFAGCDCREVNAESRLRNLSDHPIRKRVLDVAHVAFAKIAA